MPDPKAARTIIKHTRRQARRRVSVLRLHRRARPRGGSKGNEVAAPAAPGPRPVLLSRPRPPPSEDRHDPTAAPPRRCLARRAAGAVRAAAAAEGKIRGPALGLTPRAAGRGSGRVPAGQHRHGMSVYVSTQGRVFNRMQSNSGASQQVADQAGGGLARIPSFSGRSAAKKVIGK
jgi:hypothetical protein